MRKLGELFFGRVVFADSEEYREFQYKFLMVLLAFNVLATVPLIFTGQTEAAPIPAAHLNSMRWFSLVSILLWLSLRGRKQFFLPVAWLAEIAGLAELTSSIAYVSGDELRILWLFTNIPAVYLLLGRAAGAAITVLTVTGFLMGNPHLAAPYSPNAVATAVVGMFYMAAFFHAYANRSLNFFFRMREFNERLREMATRDALTGVLNARAYYEVCDRMIRVAKRNHSPYSVLFIDLDHFKSINDTHGHAAGDIVLKSVADCLTRNIRDSDALGRIGGEEFSIFLPATPGDGAVQLAENIRQAIEKLMPDIGETRLKITASVGAATSLDSDQSMTEIQQKADQAMYQAKAQGRNRVSVLETQLNLSPAH